MGGGALIVGELGIGFGSDDVGLLSDAGGEGCKTLGGGGGGISSSGSCLIFSAVRTKKSSSASAAKR